LARAQHARGFAKMSSRRKPGSSVLDFPKFRKKPAFPAGFFLAPSADLLPVRKALDSGLTSSAVVELFAGMTTP
jgi:hypothetical protein